MYFLINVFSLNQTHITIFLICLHRGPESFDLTLAYKEKEESSSSDELEEEENPISRDESIEIKSTVTQMQIKPEGIFHVNVYVYL